MAIAHTPAKPWLSRDEATHAPGVQAATWCGHVPRQRPRPHAEGASAPASLSSRLDLVPPRPETRCCEVASVPGVRANDSRLPTSEVQEPSPELSPEERRVLERKLKKERKKEEKKRLREAGIAAAQTLPAKPSAAALALEYLQGWAQKQESWRFQKTRQTWLLLHMYEEDKVPDEHFSTLLDYLEGLKGSARELTVQKAEALMQKLDEASPETRDRSLGKMQRLRQVLQLLS
ncbi:protein cholesin isoform X1 [Arvicanthis niloticus]|uniref:protein cholesin isoform X1 n=1 Tax=Arvicanthis niloticus TaxID=61156 RepID=UPI00402BAE20